MICLGFKCDRVVVISLEDKVKVCGVLISVGDYGMWDGSLENIEDNKLNGVEIISEVVIERVFDGVEVMKKNGMYGMYGYEMSLEVMICKVEWEFINSGGIVFGNEKLLESGVFDYKV